jgi:hypothetical protein
MLGDFLKTVGVGKNYILSTYILEAKVQKKEYILILKGNESI